MCEENVYIGGLEALRDLRGDVIAFRGGTWDWLLSNDTQMLA